MSGVEPNIYAATEPAEGAPGGSFVILPISPNPSITGSTPIAGRATQIEAAGSYAYVATDAGLMLAISTSTPTNPMVSGVYGSEVGSLNCIDVEGNLAAVGGANGVAILDLANQSPILSLGTFGMSNATSVHIVGNRLYVGSSMTPSVIVLDISNPAAPSPVGGFSPPGAVGSALGITQIGSIVYESAGAGGFQLFEESTEPLGGLIFNPLGSFGTSAISADLSSSGNIGFVASGDEGKLSAVNLSNPAAPSEGATFLDPSLFPQAPHSVAVIGGFIVYSRGRGGIYILAHPDLIPPTPTPFPTDTPSPSPTVSPVPTDSPTPSASPTASPTPSPSFTPSISPTPSPTPVPIPLTITGDLAAGALTQSAPHTLTFTFSAPVSGFTGDDIVVTGATKGTFTTISSLQYTLGVTGTGGTATATVADGAATGIATGGQSLASGFSFFYQDTWTISLPGPTSMDLIRIPAGTFTMGSPSDEPSRSSNEVQHQVTLTQDFYLGRTEVTQKQWLAIRGSWPGSAPSLSTTGDDYPAYNISWNDTQDFLTDLNTVITEPGTFSLPTESQWEYACRAGTTTRFYFGAGLGSDELCSTGTGRESNMWYCGNNSPDGQKIVGQKSANAWGLRDMHGNVWELCADWYDPYTGDVTDPTGPASGAIKVIRGGDYGSTAPSCRSAIRQVSPPSVRSGSIGFRVAAVRPSP